MPNIPRRVNYDEAPQMNNTTLQPRTRQSSGKGFTGLPSVDLTQINNLMSHQQLRESYENASIKFPSFKKFVSTVISTNSIPLADEIDPSEVTNYNRSTAQPKKAFNSPGWQIKSRKSYEANPALRARAKSNFYNNSELNWYINKEDNAYNYEELREMFSNGDLTFETMISNDKASWTTLRERITLRLPLFDSLYNLLLRYERFVRDHMVSKKEVKVEESKQKRGNFRVNIEEENGRATRRDKGRMSDHEVIRREILESKMLVNFFNNRIKEFRFQSKRGLYKKMVLARDLDEILDMIKDVADYNGLEISKEMVKFGKEFYDALKFEIACKEVEKSKKRHN